MIHFNFLQYDLWCNLLTEIEQMKLCLEGILSSHRDPQQSTLLLRD